MKKQMKKLLALGLAFTALTQIIQKAQAASFKTGGGAFPSAESSIEAQDANFESFSSKKGLTSIHEHVTDALDDRFSAKDQNALCSGLEEILKPKVFLGIEAKRMKVFLRSVKSMRSLLIRNLKRLNDQNKEFLALDGDEVPDLSLDGLVELQNEALVLERRSLFEIGTHLQKLITLDEKALRQTKNKNIPTKALGMESIKVYRESVVANNFWATLDYFGKGKWRDDKENEEQEKEYFRRIFIKFVNYIAGLDGENKQKLLEGDDSRQIPVSKYLVEDTPFSVDQQLVYAYALLNAGYDAPEFLIATAQLVERSQADLMSKDLLKLLVATILNKESNTDLAKEILRSFETREDRELFLLRYYVILGDTDQALASLNGPDAQRAYEKEQASLRAAEERNIAAWLTEAAQREAAQREALRKEAAAQQAGSAKIAEIFGANKKAQMAKSKVKLSNYAAGVRARAAERREKAATKIQQSFRAKKENERRKETLRIAQERKKIERKRVLLAEEEAALLKAQKEATLRRVREEAALLKAQEEAALRRVRDVSGANALRGKEKTDIVAERGWADEVGLAGGEAAVRSVEDFVTSIAGPLNKIPGIEKASKPLAMRTLLIGMLASNALFSEAVGDLADLAAEDQAPVWRAIKAALIDAGVNIDVLARVTGIADEDKAATIRLLQEGLKTE